MRSFSFFKVKTIGQLGHLFSDVKNNVFEYDRKNADNGDDDWNYNCDCDDDNIDEIDDLMTKKHTNIMPFE